MWTTPLHMFVLPHIISQAAAVTLRGIHPLKDPDFTAQSFSSILCRKRFTLDPIPAPCKCHLTAGQSPEPDGSLNPSLCLLLGCEFYSSLGCRRSVLLRSYQLSNFESHASIRKVWMENTFLREILPSRPPLHKIATPKRKQCTQREICLFSLYSSRNPKQLWWGRFIDSFEVSEIQYQLCNKVQMISFELFSEACCCQK